jgi:transposase
VHLVLESQVLHTDDTPVPVLDPEQDKTKTGRLWVYLGDVSHPYNVFAYTPNRKRDGPATFLANYHGYLQADAFGGYDGIYATQAVTEVGCNAHARRKFYEARDTDSVRALQALAYYRQLYDIERAATEAAERDGTPLEAERLRRRQQQAVPLLADFHAWLLAEDPAVLPKSAVKQAFGYALNHWAALARYTTNGCLQIDNNWAEREMKRIAIGRKNWLFAGSDQGGETAAILFSVVSSCQRHAIDPFAYLRSALASLPGLPTSELETYLPDRWASAKPATEHPQT